MSAPLLSRGPGLARLAAALSLSACAHTVVVSQSLTEMDLTRTAPAVTDGAPLAPQQFQHAEEERALARKSEADGDTASADLHAERALVAYERSVVLARLARATTSGEAARLAMAKQTDEAQRLAAARVEFEQAADATAKELAVAREALPLARTGPADAARESARLVAARSLASEGHLLCGAARLLTAGHATAAATTAARDATLESASNLESAERRVLSVRASLGAAAPARAASGESPHPLDAAARARAACLEALTRTRRASGDASRGDADALLAALSARGGWDPSRDERGIVVVLRGAFKGTTLTADADRDLRELGRVAAAHPGYPVQVVVHDATPPGAAELAADDVRGRAALAALVAGAGAPVASSVETMGAALPRTDPGDAATRARNARLEIVFVSRTD